MAKFLRLREEPPVDDFDIAIGDEFEVLAEEHGEVIVELDGFAVAFTVDPDEDGDSLHTWFDVIEK